MISLLVFLLVGLVLGTFLLLFQPSQGLAWLLLVFFFWLLLPGSGYYFGYEEVDLLGPPGCLADSSKSTVAGQRVERTRLASVGPPSQGHFPADVRRHLRQRRECLGLTYKTPIAQGTRYANAKRKFVP